MKKILCITAGLLFCAFSSQNAFSTNEAGTGGGVSQTAAGGDVTVVVTAAGVPGATSIVFTPSSNVNIEGQSSSTSFALGSWHTQALGKDNGQGYGMASDSNKMFFLDISATAGNAVGNINGTTSAVFGAPWHTL